MDSIKKDSKSKGWSHQPLSMPKGMNHGRIVSAPDEAQCLDTVQINRLEKSFRECTFGELPSECGVDGPLCGGIQAGVQLKAPIPKD